MSRLCLKLTLFIILCSLVLGSNLHAQTAQQIQQFKNLPKAQQEQLEKQLRNGIPSFSNGSSNDLGDNNQQDITYPRGTHFDKYGNPINVYNEGSDKPDGNETKDELSLYGLELFANAPSTFTPPLSIPVPANYILGPGDTLHVQLYGKQNDKYELAIGRDGNIVIPKLGPINIATKSFSEAKAFLTEQINQQIIGVKVSLSMGELRTIRVFVTGEAHKPGSYNVSSLSTITHALFVSGGVSDIASLRNIQLKRSGKLIQTLDLYDLLLKGDTSDDALLQSGDAIFIPSVVKTVSIDGQVRRPAIYELKSEESIKDVLNLAGGTLADGFVKAIGLRRFDDGQQIQLTVNAEDKVATVKDGDLIHVPKISPFVSDSVTLIGAVARPGRYQWRQKMFVSELLGNVGSDLLEETDLTYVLVLRQINANRDIEVLQVDLTEIALKQNDLALKPNDKIVVFSKIETNSLTDIKLSDFAFEEQKLKENEKERWHQRVQEQLFWEKVGVYDDSLKSSRVSSLDGESEQDMSLIELTTKERKHMLEFKEATYFSRKRLLTPIIQKLQEQAKYGNPLQLVEVVGEVKVPGVYPLTKNGSIKGLIKAAGGLTESSYLARSEITRTSVSESGVADVVHLDFSPSAILEDDKESSIRLKSKDRINILEIPSWQEELKVTVKGEVEFPGEYTIKRGEKLSGLLKRVGLLTTYGDPDATIFTRESLKEQERRNLLNMAEELRKQIASESLRKSSNAGAMVSYDEAKKLLRDLTSVEAIGRMVIDLKSLLAGQENSDVMLEDGDAIYVPTKSQSVNVIGEVYVPTSHLFDETFSFEDYINRSGGLRALADEERVYIVRANGSVEIPGNNASFWFDSESDTLTIKPGDTIVVPFDSDNVDNMTLWASATQVVYQLAVAVAAIGSL
ncbi:SLBB domain-containing protein [Paraglaciecola sp.]|uniref:SLBB domain-containing protein n=1 Tax=Paraglaciecola sp. TaxID=1920173 RepID=UPI003EF1E468